MHSVYQHWDPLEVYLVGKTYPADLYEQLLKFCKIN